MAGENCPKRKVTVMILAGLFLKVKLYFLSRKDFFNSKGVQWLRKGKFK